MINKLKYAAAAALAAIAPGSASALNYFGTLTDGDIFALSTGNATFGASTFGSEGPASVTLTILNDLAVSSVLAFDTLFNFFNGGALTADGTPVADDFTVSIAAGNSVDVVLSYGVLNPGETFNATLAAVPVPAAAALMLTALGGLSLTRLRKKA